MVLLMSEADWADHFSDWFVSGIELQAWYSNYSWEEADSSIRSFPRKHGGPTEAHVGDRRLRRGLPMRPGVGHASGSAGCCSLCEMQSTVSHVAIVSSGGGVCCLLVAFVSSRASRGARELQNWVQCGPWQATCLSFLLCAVGIILS